MAEAGAQPQFDEAYVYAGTAAYTMLTKLLSDAERERILGAEDATALVEVLKETHFGTAIAGTENLDEALQKASMHAKYELNMLTPNPHLLNVLWLRYDFYNLSVLLKRSAGEYDPAEEENMVPFGTRSFGVLEKAVQTGNGGALHSTLNAAFQKAPKNADALEDYMEVKYLAAALAEAESADSPFAVQYVRLLTNLYTILSGLRAHARGHMPVHVPESDVAQKDMASADKLMEILSRFGFSKHWGSTIERYRESGNFSELDKAADEYVMKWLKRQAITLGSPAPLFAYWHVLRENVQLIRAAMTAKKVGMDEKTLREIIRTSYNAYVY